MATVNEQLQDAAIIHAIDLQKYSNGVVRRLIALLNRVDADLFQQLILALSDLDANSFTVERLDTLLNAVRIVNTEAYQRFGETLQTEVKSLAQYEAGYQFDLFRAVLPNVVPVARVTAESAYTAALSRPFQGRLLSEWASSIEADKMTRIRDAVRIGYVEGQTTAAIIKRMRGTKAAGYADGIIEIDRRNAEAVIRTAISHTAATTRDRFQEENKDVIDAVVWTSTLDGRTSEKCQLRDGLKYSNIGHNPIGHKIPWLSGPGKIHFGCRSTSVAVTKTFRELGIPIDEFTPEERASMDGAVPAETTFAQWIKKQSAARQDDVLGATRGELMRKGGLTLDKFYNEKGKFLTLDELRLKDSAAFSRAGV